MKKILTGVIVCALVFCIGGCTGKKAEEKPETNMTESETQKVDTESQILETETKVETETESNSEGKSKDTQQVKINISVYHMDSQATEILVEEHEISELSPQAIFDELKEYHEGLEGVEVNSFEEVQVDGVKVLVMDVNQVFEDCLRQNGSGGEALMRGAICNTFLKAYTAEKIKITVNGEKLESGVLEYTEYITFYEDLQQ